MRRKFESGDPLRRGSRRPPAQVLRGIAQRTHSRASSQPPLGPAPGSSGGSSGPGGPAISNAVPGVQSMAAGVGPMADLTQQPPQSFTGPGFQEFPLKMYTEDDVRNARYHILKFHSKHPVDPAGQFVPPIRLHRKDPKQLQVLAGDIEDAEDDDAADLTSGAGGAGGAGAANVGPGGDGGSASGVGAGNGFTPSGTGARSGSGNGSYATGSGAAGGVGDSSDDGRKPLTAEAKAAAALGEDGRAEPRKRPFGKKRKTRQIHGGASNDAARKLRYEEHYPWVMEDFEDKNVWVSSYEAAQSSNHAILTYDEASNGFKVIPIEKFYKMTPSARYATLSLEDAEERMESANTMRDRWLMSHLQPRQSMPTGSDLADARTSTSSRMRTVVGSEERQHKYTLDEEMDYDDQEMFDDDEGAPLMDGPEEDQKEAEDRIKREQLKANELMDADNDEDLDNLFEDDAGKEGKQARRLRHALSSIEKNQFYDSDDDQNPYASSDGQSDSNDELERNQTSAELGARVKREDDDGLVLPLVSQFRKKHINKDALPRGTAVLQLPPQVLARFAPGEWNPNAKREATPSTPPVANEDDPTLITREDILNNIVPGQTTIRQLIEALKTKIQGNIRVNTERFKVLVREVAKNHNDKLVLRS